MFLDQILQFGNVTSLPSLLSGFVIHHCLFIHGEWHVYSPNIVSWYGSMFCALAVARMCIYDKLRSTVFDHLESAIATHFLGLATSVILYRTFFHRLNKANFPGPWWARFTKLGHVWGCRTSKNHIYLHGLQAKYGDVVRTGRYCSEPGFEEQ